MTDTLEQRVKKLLWGRILEAIPIGADFCNETVRKRIENQFREPLLAAFKALELAKLELHEMNLANHHGNKPRCPEMTIAAEKEVDAVLALLDQDGKGKRNG
jgi:hypothetical protein